MQAKDEETTAKDHLRKAERDVAKLKSTLSRVLHKAHANTVRLLRCAACCCTVLNFLIPDEHALNSPCYEPPAHWHALC